MYPMELKMIHPKKEFKKIDEKHLILRKRIMKILKNERFGIMILYLRTM